MGKTSMTYSIAVVNPSFFLLHMVGYLAKKMVAHSVRDINYAKYYGRRGDGRWGKIKS